MDSDTYAGATSILIKTLAFLPEQFTLLMYSSKMIFSPTDLVLFSHLSFPLCRYQSRPCIGYWSVQQCNGNKKAVFV